MRKFSTPQLKANKVVKCWSAKAGLTLFMVMLTSFAFSQITYTRTTFTAAYTPITVGGGATQISTVGTGLGDFTTTAGLASGTEGSAHLLLPFNFNYNGTLFTGGVDFLGVNTNGYVYPITAAAGGTNLGKIVSNVNANLFTVTAPNITIAPYWDDLTIGTAINGITGTVLYQTTGAAGSQVLTIQYTNVPAFSSGNVKALNFQVKIYETTNIIEFVYGPMTNGTVTGTYAITETASIGIEGSTGGNTNYIDAVTGSKTANMTMMTSNKFTSLRNFRFTPGAPVAVAGGTYNVGVGQTYPSLSEAVADLNHRGISGAVTLNLTDAVYDTTVAGGMNIFPIVMSNITGTSAINTITISRIGSHADLRYRGTDQGNLGNQASTTIIGTTFEPMFCLMGTDFVTINNVDFTYNGIQGTTAPYQLTNGKVDNSIGVINSSSTDGATNNTFSNFVCTGDRTCTGGGQAIRHFTQTTPTSAFGANGGNTYRDFVIKNGTSGILISGNATFPDINNRVITSSCSTYNIIGDPAVANDMQNPGLSTSPFGITMTNQNGFTVSNNKIQNLTNTNATSNIVDGINVVTYSGTCVVSNNIITALRQNTASATATIHSGIKMTNTTTGTMEIRVFNNSISNITSAFNGVATITRIIRGISCLSTSNNSAVYSIYNNSVSIDGSGSLNGSNTCFEVAGTLTTAPRYDVRNNIFANFTAAQVVTPRHSCIVTNSNTLLGGTGTTVNTNNLYVANDAGVTGAIGWSTLGIISNPVGTFNTNYTTQATGNVSGDPLFFNNNSNLHATNSALLSGTGSPIPAYITTDLDCSPRVLPQHIGAYLVNACPSGTPTVSVNPAGPTCTLTPLTATTSALAPQYQWNLNGVEIFGATSSSYTPLLAGTYTVRVNNTGESCFGVSNSVVVNLSPTITVTPSSPSICDGESVTVTAAVTNIPALSYTVSSIPFAGAYAGALTNGASLPGGPGTTVGALGDEGNYNAPQNNVGTATDLPWGFNFYGRNYTKFTIHANGQLVMGTSQTSANSVFSPPAIPSVANPNNWLGFWADLSVNAADQIRWDVIGTSPSRKFIVRFTNVDFFSASPFVTFQYELNESTNDIDFYLTSVNGLTNTKAIGIEDTLVGGVVNGIAPPGRNSGTWTATNEGWKFAQVLPPTYTYAWSPATGVSSTSVANPVITPVAGTTIYTVTVTSSNGCSVTATAAVTNLGASNPAPTTTGAAICAGATGTLTASGLSTLNWYTLPVGGTLVNTGTSYTLAFPATATYYVESFNGVCPSPRTPVTITVNANPAVLPTATPSTICLGGTSQLDAGTFLSGILATPLDQNNGSSATGFDIENTSASPVILHFFQFQSSSAAGTVGVQQIWMNTTPMNCTFPTNVTIAPGWVQIASVSTTSAGTSPILTTIPFDVNITIPAGAKYAFAIGGALGQSYTSGVTLCPTPVIMASTAHIRVFQGFGGTLTGTIANRRWNGTVTYNYGDPNLNFAWSPAGDLNSATIKTPIALPPAAGPNPYTVTVTNLAGCTTTATVTVNVTALPPAPAAVVNSVPCGNGVATLTATGTGGTIKWFTAPTGGTPVFTGSPYSPNVANDTTFYVSETTLAAPFCEGPRTVVSVDIVDPDTITAVSDIAVICNQVPGTTLVTLTATNTSSPQLNQYNYVWTQASTNGGLNSFTGPVVTANPLATTVYTVTATQMGAYTVNINGTSLNGSTNQDEITWTLKDASNVTILSGGPYAGFDNNVTAGPVYSANGPFTFQITAGNALNDTNYAAFTVFCNGNPIASGCVKGSLNINETACTTVGTNTITAINGCMGTCNRIKTVRVGVGTIPVINSVTSNPVSLCAGNSATLTVAAVQGGGGGTTAPEFGTYCAPPTYTSPGLTSDFVSNVAFNTLNNPTGDGPGDYNYYPPVGAATTTVNKGTTYNMTITPTTAFSQGVAVFIDWNNNGSFADAGEFVFNGPSGIVPVTQPVTVPAAAPTANVRMRVVCVFAGAPLATWACSSTFTGGFGEVEDYTITIAGASSQGLIYSWSPAGSLNNSTSSSVTATPATTTVYTVTVADDAGCTTTQSITMSVTQLPPAPTVTGDVVCGPDTVNLSSTISDPSSLLIWTDTIGGQIVNTGTTYNKYVTQSGSYYVRELPNGPASATIGYNAGTAPVGFFPDVASFMNFTVSYPGGIIINTVQVSTNLGAGTWPLVVALVNPAGQIVSVHDTIFITGGSTALQTIVLDMYVPQGSWRLQPIFNPNLSVHQSAAVAATVPSWTLSQFVTINCFGNASSACFSTNTFGLFYNWVIVAGCNSPTVQVNYTVNTPPPIGITSSNGLFFCDSINTTLTAIDSTSAGYTFTWSPATGLSASTGATVTVSGVTQTTTYTVTAYESVSGCHALQEITLTVNPNPVVTVNLNDTSICANVPSLVLSSSASKSSVIPVGTRFDANFVSGLVYGGNTTQFSQMIFTAAELNAAGLVGPTNISSLAFFVASKLTTTTYTVDIKMRSDALIPASWPSTAHINTGLTTVYTNPAIASALGWNTYNFTTQFPWDGVSNVLVSACFTHNIPGFFDVVSTSNVGAQRYNALNASACNAATGALAVVNPNDRPNVRFTGGNVLYAWSPALGLSSSTEASPTFTTSLVPAPSTTTYVLTVTDPLSGCTARDSVSISVITTALMPVVNPIGDSVFCFNGKPNMYLTGSNGVFQWQQSSDGINFGDIPGASNDTLSDSIAVTRYYRVGVTCGTDTTFSRVLTFIVNNPEITSVTGDTICGVGQVCLSATVNNPGYFIQWFDNATGGNVVATGGSYCKTIGTTDTLWVQATVDTSSLSASGNVFYMRASAQATGPWGNNTNDVAMNTVFGAGNWSTQFFETGNAATIFATTTKIVFMDGSDGGPAALNAFLTANLPVIQNWVSGGGHLFLNAGPNSGGNINFGFGGVTCAYPNFTATAIISPGQSGHPIFNNVTYPAGVGPWTGGSYGHAWITGPGITKIIQDQATSNAVLAQLDYGNGRVLFGGMTTVNFHSPQPQATNIRNAALAFLNTGFSACNSARVPVIGVSTPPPSINIETLPSTICQLTCTPISVDSASQANYQVFTWTPAAGLSATTGASVTACPDVTTTYIVTGFDIISGNDCANSDTITITVTPAPVVNITTTGSPGCAGDTAQISTTVIPFIPPLGNYSVSSIPFAPVTPTGTPVVLQNAGTLVTPLSSGSADDGTWQNIPLPVGFAFNYYGTTPTAMSVSTNGFLTFTANSALSGCCSGQVLPNAIAPNDVIAYGWEDWNQTAGTTDYFTNGVAPFRQFVVRSQGIPRFGGTGAPSTVMVILNETSNTVDIQITSITCGASDVTTLGIENATGTLGTAVAGRNGVAAWAATNEGWRFSPPVASGITYAWSPPAGLSSTSISNPTASPASTTTYTVLVTETGTGCTRTASTTIVISPIPAPIITPGDSLACAGAVLSYYVHAVDTDGYPGGYPPGTTFDWSTSLGGPVADLDSTEIGPGVGIAGNISVIVHIPDSLGGCEGTASIFVNYDEPNPALYMSQDSVSCTPDNDGIAIASVLFANTPFRYIWVNSTGDTIRNVVSSASYIGPFDSDLDNILDDFDNDNVPDLYTIYTDSAQGLIVGNYTVYVSSNALSDSIPNCYATGSINVGRVPCIAPQLTDPCVCVDNADVSRRMPLTDGQFEETVSILGGASPWTIVSLTTSTGNPASSTPAVEDCIDNFTQTTAVADSDIVVVTPNDSSYLKFYLFEGDTYTLTVMDANGVILTISGGGCSYPAAPINDTVFTVCGDNFTANVQDLAFPNGIDPSIVLQWYDDSTCFATPLTYGQLGNIPFDYPDLSNAVNPGPGGATDIGYTQYNFYVSSDSVNDELCEGKRAMVSILSNVVEATVDSLVNVNCNGESSGAIYITMTNGTAPFTYQWTNGSTDEDQVNLVAGTYDVLITDSLGCTYFMSYDIIENPPLVVGKSIKNPGCYADSSGQIVLFVSGGVPFTTGPAYSYLWSNGQTTNIANNLSAGTYTVTITDGVGCDSIFTFHIFDPQLLDKTYTITHPLCFGGTGSIDVTAFGGTPWSGMGPHAAGYEYTLDGGAVQFNGSFTGLAGGSHTIAIMDSNNCVTYLIFTINVPPALVCGGAVIDVMCNGGTNGSITANVSGGTGGYTYLWNDGSTNQTLAGVPAGFYFVVVTDANGCSIMCTYTVSEPLPITYNASACANVSCYGANDGKACITNVLGGTPPYTYQWNTLPVQTTAQATGLSPGTWTVTLTDAMGCMIMADVVITGPVAPLTVSGVVTNPVCAGGNNGNIAIAVSGGTSPYTVLWSNGNTTMNNNGLTAGSYTVTVTDSNNCVVTMTYTVTDPAALLITLNSTNVSCDGGGNGSITAVVSGGTAPYTYTWSTGNTTAVITGVGAGIYTVTVTDANGCTSSASSTITSPSALNCICNGNVTNVSCFGGSNGSVTAQPVGGTPPYSYVWNNGATTQTISSLTAGNYTVTITDANGCTKVGTATVTQPAQLFVFVSGQNLTCAGNNSGAATATVVGGVLPYTYLWTPTGQTTATATGLGAGTYTVLVQDANGCTASAQVILTQPAGMTLTSKRTNVSCNGGSNGTITVVATGGTPGYTYLWSNGATTKYVIGLVAGTYTVTVTDASGCTKTLSATITQPAALVALYTITNVSCNGGQNGAVTLTVTGGTSPYKYLWSNGTTTKNLSGVPAGTYSVQVKDFKGCIINATAVITQPAAISLSISPKAPKCFGGNNGQATVTATGGTTPYLYLWSNGATTATATGLIAGTYTVTITDNKGCTASASTTLSQPAALSCAASVVQGIICNGGTGKIGVTVTGGTPGYSYIWNTVPIATTAIVNNVVAGTYTVIVKDKNNCTTSCVVTITEPAAITCLPLTSTNVTCNGLADGTATIAGITGGTAPYTLLWNSGVAQTTPTATGLSAGTYVVTITDANGCTKTASVTITQPPVLTATYSVINPTCDGGLGTITVTAGGGTGPYSYTLSPGSTTNNTGVFGLLSPSLYSVLVTDAAGCTLELLNIQVNPGATITANPLTQTNVSCNGGSNGTAAISGITGGTAPYTISWNTIPPQGTTTATGLSAGTYTVTVTDAGGCTYTASAIITEPALPVSATITAQTNLACNGGGLGSATVTGLGGTPYTSGPAYTYLWNNGQTTETATGLIAGSYAVTVTDSLGCSAYTQLIITQPGSLTLSASGINTLCNGDNTGIISAFAQSGTQPYTFVISPAAGTQTNPTADSAIFSGLTAGSYTITVTDAGGCTAETDIDITEPSAMAMNLSNTNILCNGAQTASATASVIGGTAGVVINVQGNLQVGINSTNSFADEITYELYDASNIVVLSGGPYSFGTVDLSAAVAANNGPYTLKMYALGIFNDNYTDWTVYCNGSPISNGCLMGAQLFGICPNVDSVIVPGLSCPSSTSIQSYAYLWSNSQTTQTATGLGAGTYTVTATDGNGCSITDSIVISDVPALAIAASQVNVPCNGQGTGQATALVSGGTSPYNYLWSNGQQTATATGLTAGIYVVTVTDYHGCTAEMLYNITSASNLVASPSSTPITCYGGTSVLTVNPSGGTPPYSYAWSQAPGNNTNTATVSAGVYYVTITDSAGCIVTYCFNIAQPSALLCAANSTMAACNGGMGTAWVTASGGVSSIGQNVYYMTAANGEPWGELSNINEMNSVFGAGNWTPERFETANAGLIFSPATTYVFMDGSDIGADELNAFLTANLPAMQTWVANGGRLFINSAPNEGNNINMGFGGITLQYTFNLGPYSDNAVIAAGQGGHPIFAGPLPAGTAWTGFHFGHSIFGAGATPLITGDAPGDVLDELNYGAGKVLFGAMTMSSFHSPQPDATNLRQNIHTYMGTGINQNCNGYTYLWSNGATTANITDVAGNYTVIVTDCNGCTSVCSVTIGQAAPLSVGTSNTNVTCQNPLGTAVAIAGGGTPPYTYLWSNNATTSAITGLAPGTYTVTVNDANNCGPVTAQATILAPNPVTCSTTSTMVTCNGYHTGTATVTPGGGNGVYSVIWNTTPSQTTLTATGMAAGTYTVIVMDGLGCSSTCSVTVLEPSPLVYSYNVNNTCAGSNGGTATINGMGGTMYTVGNPYTYLWSNGQTTQTATGLVTGTYYVTVTDSMGCAIQAIIFMPQGQSMTCNTFCTPTACGQATGTATVNVFGGVGPYTYQWSNGSSNVINTGLTAGVYTVLVTDAQGCTTTCIANVGQPVNIQYGLTVVNPACNGGTGSISISNLNGGQAPYTYLWSNGATTLSITGQVAGTYTVIVTDTNSCSISQSATIVEPALLQTVVTGTNVSCNGYTNGSVAVVASGGVAPYNYNWNTGGSLSYMNNLGAGIYTVTVTDANGCTSTGSYEVTQPALLDTISTASTPSMCGLCNGAGSVLITGGTAPYSYLWSNGNTTSSATGLCAGNNFVTVTDSNGCSISVCVKVTDMGSFTAILTSPVYAGGYNIRCNGGLDGAINLTTNPAGSYTYLWSGGETTEDVFGVGAGNYSVIVSNGLCTQTISITLTQPPLLTASASGTNVNCAGNNNGTATATAVGGVMPYTYLWNNGQTTQTATGLMAGTYTVTVGDANGCTTLATVTLLGPSVPLALTETHVTPTCYGSTNGSIDLTVTGGTAPYSYIWTNGATTQDLSNIGAGSHTVTVTDANGCTITLCIVLTEPNAIVISMSTTNASCNGGNNGSASASVSGGTSPYAYLWNNGGTTSTITNLYAGTYTVTVTDANGCTASMTKSLSAPAGITVVVDSTKNVSSYGGNNGAIYISLNGGIAPFTYQWNTIPVKTTEDVTGLTAGTYLVNVTDASGCIGNATVTITQPNYLCTNGTAFHTETPATWSTAGNGSNIGTYLINHFPYAFPASLVVGGGCPGSKTLTLTSATATRNFLLGQPLSGGSNVLPSNLVNATSATFSSALAANVVALKLNVVFDGYDANFAPVPTVWLGTLIYSNPGGPAGLNGLTVNQVLFEAEKKLGGCSSPYTAAQLTTACNNINLSYLGGIAGTTSTMLSCPAPPKAGDISTSFNGNIMAYPNPTSDVLNIRFVTDVQGKLSIRMFDALGRMVWNASETAFEGTNDRSYDMSQLQSGVYMLNVEVNGINETIRIIIK